MLERGGFCGLDCDACPSLAVGGDVGAVDPGTIPCGGCFAGPSDAPGCSFEDCRIRSCALERGVPTCALCDRYVCGPLEEFFRSFPGGDEARKNLDFRRKA
ncbi:MAG: DUF3795 domain-containing protein [bacterium]|nr:DUF3795 domain-containing protein [bacterium]